MHVRTTIDLSEFHRRFLHTLAQSRGYRGYSKILKEIISFFVDNNPFNRQDRINLLRLRGSWRSSDVEKIHSNLVEVRKNWKK